MKLIDVEELKDDIAVLLERNEKLIDPWLAIVLDDTIEEQAVIEAEPVRRGRWQVWYHGEDGFSFNCTECGTPAGWRTNYCPNCGARMEEQE